MMFNGAKFFFHSEEEGIGSCGEFKSTKDVHKIKTSPAIKFYLPLLFSLPLFTSLARGCFNRRIDVDESSAQLKLCNFPFINVSLQEKCLRENPEEVDSSYFEWREKGNCVNIHHRNLKLNFWISFACKSANKTSGSFITEFPKKKKNLKRFRFRFAWENLVFQK